MKSHEYCRKYFSEGRIPWGEDVEEAQVWIVGL